MSARYESPVNSQSQPQFGENGIIADIVNIITGNRISSNTYDDCGNVTYDSASGTTLEWNSIGLIKKVSGTSGTLVNYSYLADGTKTYSFSSVTHHLYKNRIFSWIFYKTACHSFV